ncbi:MAG: tetratricopeptide repeat protein [Candidatus Rifleibacteriota bacterium]
MAKKLVQLVILVAMVVQSTGLIAVSSTAVFDEAQRAFNLGNYTEAEEIFSRFIAAWPDHEKASQAKYHRLIARSRSANRILSEQASSLNQELTSELATIRKEFTDTELAEVEAAITYSGQSGNLTWEQLSRLTNNDLSGVISRQWYPDPAMSPLDTLKFANHWLARNNNDSDPQLKAAVSYIKALALWQMLLSPLSIEANSLILKTWEDLPVHSALDKAIRTSFDLGDIDLKKKVALLGFHFDWFRHKGLVQSGKASGLKSRWLTYLSQRGCNLQEAWCPR